MSDIVLATINARHSHAALGLRYLLANLGELESRARLREFVLGQRPADIVEALLADQPRIVGLGVYVWNADESLRVAQLLKRVAPEVRLVLGGPEVSHEADGQEIVGLADHVIAGQADLAFAELCRRLLAGEAAEKFLHPPLPPLDMLVLPYRLYDEADIRHRLIYVEASRGCPFRCEFCLSALDKTAWPFDLERFLAEMAELHRRGVRQFKFVDRTFNLNPRVGRRILDFFLQRLDADLFLHFEVVPDHLPDPLREAIVRFPPGTLQFEIGVQTFNPEVQALINRSQDNARSEANLRWLRQHTHAHLHADLIVGLPGENLASFAAGFDRLAALAPHDIQVGMLKRLRGAPIARHERAYDLRFDPRPPYQILATDRIDFATMQRLARFARYWEMMPNSGRFARSLKLLLGDAPFDRFMRFSDWLWGRTGQTHRIALDRQYDLMHAALTEEFAIAGEAARAALAADYAASGARGAPACLRAPSRPE